MRGVLVTLLLVLFSVSALAIDEIGLGAQAGKAENMLEIHYATKLGESLSPNTQTVVILVVNRMPQMAFFNRLDGMFLITMYDVDRFMISVVLMVQGRPPVHSSDLVFINGHLGVMPRIPGLKVLQEGANTI